MEPTSIADSQPQTVLFRLKNFQIKLSNDRNQLTIDAEQENPSKHFFITLTPENIEEVTSFTFTDTEVMYLELRDAFENKTPGTEINITDDARILYSQEKEVCGGIERKQFTLCLDEKKLHQEKEQDKQDLLKLVAQQEARIQTLEGTIIPQMQKMLEKTLVEFERKLNLSEERIQALENENVKLRRLEAERLSERMQALEGIISAETQKNFKSTLEDLERKVNCLKELQESVSKGFEFDPTCKHASCFSMSAGNKTITYNSNQNEPIPCFSKQLLPKSQKTVFSVKIDNTSNSHLMIGICPSILTTEERLWNKDGVYCYQGYENGYVYAKGRYSALNDAGFATGSVVTVTVDLLNNTLAYELNGRIVHTSNLDPFYINLFEYIAYVELNEKDEKASFV